MLRLLLACVAVLLLLGLAPQTTPALLAAAAVEAVDDDCACCPESDGIEGDCCDWDLGACCATSVAAAMPPAAPLPVSQGEALRVETHEALPLHLLLPSDNGPPPTPPPIG